ncbi:structural protein [Flavobacterium phage vB_FspM_lotta8-1]|uniref:Structural protein n=1 Tax=Flavobacterium phage vB_FspM_lotta8-1 TaxID=2686242 RepID=A0A6B9LKI1_9CAUD|nr:structural protein [Flavobacterium phage vB_FspM_lotta8-1]QHB38504.1 structural protein [Flavobacterium phage vB_FspM_lotta8-1]
MKKPISTLKTFFETGDKPTEQQFADLIDSFIHKDEGFVITQVETTAGGLTITFSDGSSEFLPVFALENQEISFINGLQAFIDAVNLYHSNLVLTENNFSNQNLQDLTDLLVYIQNISENTFTGDFNVLNYNFGSNVFTGGTTIGDLIAEINPPIEVLKGQITRFFYREADFSDGNHALKNIQKTLALPSGIYGFGQLNDINFDAFVISEDGKSDTENIILNRPFRGLNISRYIDGFGNDFDTQRQSSFNTEVYNKINVINLETNSLRSLKVTDEEIEFQDAELLNEFDGVSPIKINTSFEITAQGTPDAQGFSSVLMLTNDSATAGVVIQVEAGIFGDEIQGFNAGFKFSKNTSGTEVLKYVKTKEIISAEEQGSALVSVELIADLLYDGTLLTGSFIVNDEIYDVEDLTEDVDIIDVSPASISALSAGVRIGWSGYNSAEFILNYFGYNRNGGNVLRRFWLNEKNETFFYDEDKEIEVLRGGTEVISKNEARIQFDTDKMLKNGKGKAMKLNDLVNYAAQEAIYLSKKSEPKIYKALITQTGTAAPTVVILKNTLGNIVWSRGSTGYYLANLTGAFTAKTALKVQQSTYGSDWQINRIDKNNIDEISISVADVNTLSSLDDGLNDTLIEIEVYN